MTKINSTLTDPRKYLSEVLKPLDFENSNFEERQRHIKNVLARYLNLKTVVALIGAGGSYPIGYPSWNDFANFALDVTRKSFHEKSAEIDRYKSYLGDSGKEMSAQVILEECERLFAAREKSEKKQSKTFRKIIKEYFEGFHKQFKTKKSFRNSNFSSHKKFNEEHNPYSALLKLPIRRFITTNYDFEIERVLLAKKKISNNLTLNEISKLPIEKQGDKLGIRELTRGKSFLQRGTLSVKN